MRRTARPTLAPSVRKLPRWEFLRPFFLCSYHRPISLSGLKVTGCPTATDHCCKEPCGLSCALSLDPCSKECGDPDGTECKTALCEVDPKAAGTHLFVICCVYICLGRLDERLLHVNRAPRSFSPPARFTNRTNFHIRLRELREAWIVDGQQQQQPERARHHGVRLPDLGNRRDRPRHPRSRTTSFYPAISVLGRVPHVLQFAVVGLLYYFLVHRKKSGNNFVDPYAPKGYQNI